ncbi:MAG: IS21 family transposase [Actinomycetota bacterium]|nr:IS21 family transposase [Actinomycetota bacterium]
MISVEDWAEIRRLHRAEEMPIKAIARRLGISRNAVRRALARDSPPRYQRPAKGSCVDAFEPAIRGLLRAYPRMPATVIAERVGWERSITVLKDRVRELRPVYLPPDPASRTTYVAGDRVQCDLWFPPVDIPLGHGQVGRPPVLVMAAGYSRMLFAVMIPSRQASDLIAGHWLLLSQHLGAVPRQLVWDNESAVGSWRAGKPRLTEDFDAFRGVLGCGVHQCRPRDPEAKGIVERGNGYLETSFLPGRSFDSPGDFNTQLWAWLPVANQRIVRRTGCAPASRWEADRAAMLSLPPVPPTVGWRHELRLPRDHYVRVDGNDYSVDPAVVGRKVAVRADLTRVSVTAGERVVAEHARCWGRHQSITDPAHHAAALALAARARTAAARPDPQVVQERDLGVYDAAFGITDGQVA